MLSNMHTHTTYCDGDNTPEQIVLSAIEKGFCSIGFSGHGYTDFDLEYCMKDTSGYIKEINALKEKYEDKIQIYLGVEEDAHCFVQRDNFDYIIGSSHYTLKNGRYYPIDGSAEEFYNCLKVWDNDPLLFAEDYYTFFTDYIVKRKPEIIGHFDLIAKYEETLETVFLNNNKYLELTEKYIDKIIGCNCLFEVNTGAMSRGLRTTPYPSRELLHYINKKGGKVILSSDAHSADMLDYGFEKTKDYLYDIGFKKTSILYNGKFIEI